MKFVSVRDLRLHPGQVWQRLVNEEVIVTSNGKPIALITGVNEATLAEELEAHRRAKALLALDELHRVSVHQETDRLGDEEIEEEISAVRQRRRR